jgi:folate-binding protein YgfZ
LLDAPLQAVADLQRRLSRFRVRAAVTLRDLSDSLRVYAAWDGMPPQVPITAPDPRLELAGYRLISSETIPDTAAQSAYDAHRLSMGLPDGPPDLEPEKTLLLEAGFDELGGVAWDKGCYMGQELTARTKYRGLVKRRLVPVTLDSAPPAAGTPIRAGDAAHRRIEKAVTGRQCAGAAEHPRLDEPAEVSAGPARLAQVLSLAATGLITEVIVDRTTLTVTFGAMSTSSSVAPSVTFLTVPMMPPAVTTRSPRFRAASSAFRVFCWVC